MIVISLAMLGLVGHLAYTRSTPTKSMKERRNANGARDTKSVASETDTDHESIAPQR
jgi:hypothetical protein